MEDEWGGGGATSGEVGVTVDDPGIRALLMRLDANGKSVQLHEMFSGHSQLVEVVRVARTARIMIPMLEVTQSLKEDRRRRNRPRN